MRNYGSTKYGASRAPVRCPPQPPHVTPDTGHPGRAVERPPSRPTGGPGSTAAPRRAACRARGPTATPPRRVSRLHAERVRGWTGVHSLLASCCSNPHVTERGGVRIVITNG